MRFLLFGFHYFKMNSALLVAFGQDDEKQAIDFDDFTARRKRTNNSMSAIWLHLTYQLLRGLPRLCGYQFFMFVFLHDILLLPEGA